MVARSPTQAFTATEGKVTKVDCKGFEKGGPTTPLEKREALPTLGNFALESEGATIRNATSLVSTSFAAENLLNDDLGGMMGMEGGLL